MSNYQNAKIIYSKYWNYDFSSGKKEGLTLIDHSFKGSTKEDYLLWRKNWREIYKNLSEDIRILKLYRKDSDIDTQSYAQSCLRSLAMFATKLLKIRVESKVTANANYLKMKECENV